MLKFDGKVQKYRSDFFCFWLNRYVSDLFSSGISFRLTALSKDECLHGLWSRSPLKTAVSNFWSSGYFDGGKEINARGVRYAVWDKRSKSLIFGRFQQNEENSEKKPQRIEGEITIKWPLRRRFWREKRVAASEQFMIGQCYNCIDTWYYALFICL